MKTAEIQTVDLDIKKIRTDGGTQPRASLDDAVVAEYAEAIGNGATFPPGIVFYDGEEHWLADGFHRLAGHAAAERKKMACEVRQGTRRDAVLFSVGANATHGLPRTNADKRRAVTTLLNDPEWVKWSDREIARRCGVSHNFSSELRRSLSSDDSDKPEPRTYTTKHGSTATMATANIGSRPSATTPPKRIDFGTDQTVPDDDAGDVAVLEEEPEPYRASNSKDHQN